jgi:hypothetical protein
MASEHWARFDKSIGEATRALIAAQVSPWANLLTAHSLSVRRHDGSGIVWTDTKYGVPQQDIFWRGYIDPFVEELVSTQMREAGQVARKTQGDREILVAEVRDLLLRAVRKIYDRMADVDQQLRGDGFPQSVTRRSIKTELRVMEQYIDKQARATAAAATLGLPGPSSVEGYFKRYRMWIGLAAFGVVVLVVALAML